MFRTWPCPQVGAAFANQLWGQGWTKAMNLGQINVHHTVKGGANIEGWGIHLALLTRALGRRPTGAAALI